MASLQQLKDRLSGKITEEPISKKSSLSKTISKPQEKTSFLEIEEARYLLSLIARTDFSGKDIQIVYNTALKLQEILQQNLNKENNNG